MNPMLQQWLVLLIVTVAVAYTGRRLWRSVEASRKKKSGGGCGPDCGCGE
jgi:hypothetical protein